MSRNGERRERLCVLTVIDSLATAGAEIVATRVALGLDRRRFETIICSTRRSKPEWVAAVRSEGLEVLELGRESRWDVWKWAPLVRLLRSGRVDVVHSHKFGSNVWLSLFSRLPGMPVLVTHEHSWSYEGATLRRLLDRRLIAPAAAAMAAVSPSDRGRMIELEGIPAEKVVLVPNGIPAVEPADRARARAALGIPDDVPVVGTVCGLRPEKELATAVRSLSMLSTRHPRLRFVVVGDGPERASLERLAQELSVQVDFLGHRPNEEIPELLAAMDVMVCSSRFEGMPLAILEWMAAGKAIVATRVGGIPTIIEDGREGLLVPPLDPGPLAEAVGRLLDSPSDRSRLGDAARRRQREEFRFEMTLTTLEALYERVYAERAG